MLSLLVCRRASCSETQVKPFLICLPEPWVLQRLFAVLRLCTIISRAPPQMQCTCTFASGHSAAIHTRLKRYPVKWKLVRDYCSGAADLVWRALAEQAWPAPTLVLGTGYSNHQV